MSIDVVLPDHGPSGKIGLLDDSAIWHEHPKQSISSRLAASSMFVTSSKVRCSGAGIVFGCACN